MQTTKGQDLRRSDTPTKDVRIYLFVNTDRYMTYYDATRDPVNDGRDVIRKNMTHLNDPVRQ